MVYRLFLISLLSVLGSCKDETVITDTNQSLSSHNWSYIQKINIPVLIADEKPGYNLYLNLRHSADYKYANIFVLIHQTDPQGRRTSERREFKLALPDGEWLGSGSGNMYSYQLLLKENYHFPSKGNYIFEIEQNMRDNPLREVTDVGMRVERAE